MFSAVVIIVLNGTVPLVFKQQDLSCTYYIIIPDGSDALSIDRLAVTRPSPESIKSKFSIISC